MCPLLPSLLLFCISFSPSLPCLLSTVLPYLPSVINPARQPVLIRGTLLGQVEPNHPFHPDFVSLNFLLTTRIPYVLYEYCQTLTYATSTPNKLYFTLPSFLLPPPSLFPFPPLSLDLARYLPSLSISPSPLPRFVLSSSLDFGLHNIRVGPLPICFNFPPFHISSIDI